jgi:putative solute:sodium symporter small subunit
MTGGEGAGGQTPGGVYHHEGENEPVDTRHDRETLSEETVAAYWKANIRLLLSLLAVWAVVGYGLSIFLVDELDAIRVFGFKLGFWFAQQGAIYIFVILIFVYVYAMKRIERRFGVDDDAA